ncbi:unnamed protein product [Ilex paraguariensis]|uniref:Uncharacterized protein n=1 Tax=Ilex paraguariensis TaxID=185542 RepID=A0ABC8UIR9_9AQUA
MDEISEMRLTNGNIKAFILDPSGSAFFFSHCSLNAACVLCFEEYNLRARKELLASSSISFSHSSKKPEDGE